jgi:ankyrin repeat protein
MQTVEGVFPLQTGILVCPKCGEQHGYIIADGEFKLDRVSVPVGGSGSTVILRPVSEPQKREPESAPGVLDERLFTAVENGDAAAVHALLDEGANPGARDRYELTPLYHASESGYAEIVKILLDRGADPNVRNGGAGTALKRARTPEIATLLLARGADVNAADSYGMTALAWAATAGRADVARVLLDHGAEVDAHSHPGLEETPLMHAASQGKTDVVRILLERGANVNAARADNGYSSLMIAAGEGRTEVVGVLIDAGAPVDAKDRDRGGWTALHVAINHNEADVIRVLVEKGANINLKGGHMGGTALTWAATLGYPDIVQRLLDRGADVNAQDGNRCTALIYAAKNGHTAIVQALLDRGAATGITDYRGMTALSHAIQEGHEDVARLLKIPEAEKPTRKPEPVPVIDEAKRQRLLAQFGRQLDDADLAVIDAWQRLVGAQSTLYNYPGIPPKKFANATRSYAKLGSEDIVIALQDSTAFGSAKEGALFTTRFLCWKCAGTEGRVSYQDIDPTRVTFINKMFPFQPSITIGDKKAILFIGNSPTAIPAMQSFLVEASRIRRSFNPPT